MIPVYQHWPRREDKGSSEGRACLPWSLCFDTRCSVGCCRHPHAPLAFVHVGSDQFARGEDVSVKINLMSGVGPDPTLAGKLSSMEESRYQLEKSFFEAVMANKLSHNQDNFFRVRLQLTRML